MFSFLSLVNIEKSEALYPSTPTVLNLCGVSPCRPGSLTFLSPSSAPSSIYLKVLLLFFSLTSPSSSFLSFLSLASPLTPTFMALEIPKVGFPFPSNCILHSSATFSLSPPALHPEDSDSVHGLGARIAGWEVQQGVYTEARRIPPSPSYSRLSTPSVPLLWCL